MVMFIPDGCKTDQMESEVKVCVHIMTQKVAKQLKRCMYDVSNPTRDWDS